ncbi:5150_t:CDS:2 [Dentiscutata heterogama]|uniref:5150_t:CDS:1 n=1 Tax=Dentiscutata heterogama TaxID=1316150 RepID=A0ACA9M7A1_9GLOM|nr:5150_t:CDS:2 [Dentiscutata heterogama]
MFQQKQIKLTTRTDYKEGQYKTNLFWQTIVFQEPKEKKKRKSLTSSQKAKVCQLRQEGVSQVKIAEKFSVAEATISGIAHYKKIFCEDRIDVFDTFLESGDSPEPITIKDAIDFVTAAWNKDFLSELFSFEELDQDNKPNITSEIQSLISAEEYIIADTNLITTEMPNDDEIIEAVKNRECIELGDEVPNKLISFTEALEFINRILLFLEQQPDGSFKVNESLIRNLRKLKKNVKLKYINSSRQVILDPFIFG